MYVFCTFLAKPAKEIPGKYRCGIFVKSPTGQRNLVPDNW